MIAAGTAVWAAVVLGVPAVRSGALAGGDAGRGGADPARGARGVLRAGARRPGDAAAAIGGGAGGQRAGPARSGAPSRPNPAPVPDAPYDLRVRGLTARWEADGPDVLRGLDLDVPAGQRVAVIGPSGCGKTTLAMVLLRFLDPAAGTVTIGGADITALESDAVRRIIGLCAQDAHIFDSTLEANLRLARPEASPGELRERAAPRPACWTGWTACPTGWPPRSASTAPGCPAASGSGSPSPGCCSRTSRSSSSTSPPSISTTTQPAS